MTKRHQTPAVILSAELESNTKEKNEQVTIMMRCILSKYKFSFKEVRGVYKGSSEVSFMVLAPLQSDIDTLKEIAFEAAFQESILYKDSSSNCYLEYNDGTCESIGKIKEVEENEALSSDNYTKMDNKYFICA